MTKGSDNVYPKLILGPLGAPAAPSDASWKLYPMADGVYARSSNAVVGPLSAGAGGSSTFCGAKAYATSTQSITASTIAMVTFDSEEYDTDAIHDTSTNPTRFTVPAGKAGKWLFTGGFWVDAATSADAQVGFRLNGTTLLRGTGVASATTFTAATAHTIVSLSEGDYVELYYYTTSTGRSIGHASSPDAQAWAAATFLGA